MIYRVCYFLQLRLNLQLPHGKKCKEHKQATCENETGTGVTVAVPTDSMGTFAVSKRHKHPITK